MSHLLSFDVAVEERFQAYTAALAGVLGGGANGHEARRRGLNDYMSGLILPGERKSLEPMAERLEGAHSTRVSARHQSIHHFVCEARWSDAAVRERVRDEVLPVLQAQAPIRHWIIDDTTVLKKGRCSVGVDVQYSGQIKTTANCQSLVSLSLANEVASLPVAVDLYLPQSWTDDPRRRLQAGIPATLPFRTKHDIALAQLKWACEAGLPRGLVLLDGGFGTDRALREGIRALGLDYAVGIDRDLTVVPVSQSPPSVAPHSTQAAVQAGATRVDALARTLPSDRWQRVSWREGSAGRLSGRFAALRVRTAPTNQRGYLGPEEWLLIQAAASDQPERYWLISLPADTELVDLIFHAKQRWRVEQDYKELKQEVGLGDFEGRGWRGLNHHVTLCLAAYGFLVRERSLFPPEHSARTGARRAA